MNRQELEKWLENFSSRYDSGKEELRDRDVIETKSVYKYNDEQFYKEYAKLLNCRSEKFEVTFDESYQKPGLIFKSKVSGEIYYLKSDQFGFSRPDHKFNYPYAKYLEKVLEYDKENMENAFKKVFTWMFKTRQVGGSFFWPLEEDNNKIILKDNPLYNKIRGSRSYIQDRVDLTLFEIYEYYENSEIEGNILIKNADKNIKMKEWLDEFDSFKEYVKFFALTPFIDGNTGRPYNFLSYSENTPFDKTLKRQKGIVDSNMTIEKYEEMFDKIVEKIEKRREILYCKYYNVIE